MISRTDLFCVSLGDTVNMCVCVCVCVCVSSWELVVEKDQLL